MTQTEIQKLKMIKDKLLDVIFELDQIAGVIKKHVPVESTVKNGSIIEILCSCGKLTKYKVPLKLISDFHCPKDKDDQ